MSSSAPSVNDRKPILVGRPRRFYIDDILASDFGPRRPGYCRPVSYELNENRWTVADTEAASQKDHHPNVADSTVSLNNEASSKLFKSTGELALPTASRPTSSSVTSSRRFHDNDVLADTSSCSTSCNRRRALKNAVKLEPCGSTTTELTADIDTPGTICAVTSSTTSHATMIERKRGKKDDGKDYFTLPAWVYCTRYSDRPSAGNVTAKLHTV